MLGLPDGAVIGCPFSGVYGPGEHAEWLDELLTARALVESDSLPWPDALGRDLAACDVDALATWRRALARVDRIEREDREKT